MANSGAALSSACAPRQLKLHWRSNLVKRLRRRLANALALELALSLATVRELCAIVSAAGQYGGEAYS